ncbi:toxic anion resistance protein [Lysinibacillus sp. SGAir0095]|uniref:toxic anion resistance protein n=1 Tax=Lysinibacillus sp. SGAir0095 TaxID=2070463 RepID=UPI0010CD1F45|nr:toxic anion resistance protein [Lysinibacillus sp. SGAir0095]QCR32421.1 toxic anion resistance protein [Lysinibacillus sp. SGAir0095]
MSNKKSPNHPFEEFSNNEGSFLHPFANNHYTIETPVYSTLSEEKQSHALLLASKLDVSQYENILHFGSEIQHSLKNFTHNMLIRVQRNDTSPIREILHKLMEHLSKINPDDLIEKEKGFLQKLFTRSTSSIQEQMTQYNRLSKQIDRLGIQLQHSQKGLLSDLKMLNELYQLNEEYYHNLNTYIAAAEMKKKDIIAKQLPKLEQSLDSSNNPLDKQRLNDLQTSIEWLDKRLYDLQISREIAIQTAPQIRMIQQTNQMLVEKIQSSVMTTIPLWQTQISMLINMNNQRRANQTTRRLMETSEQMLHKNAKMLETTAKDTSKKKALSHHEIDLFKQTQLELINSIEETLRVQAISNEQQASIEATIIERA